MLLLCLPCPKVRLSAWPRLNHNLSCFQDSELSLCVMLNLSDELTRPLQANHLGLGRSLGSDPLLFLLLRRLEKRKQQARKLGPLTRCSSPPATLNTFLCPSLTFGQVQPKPDAAAQLATSLVTVPSSSCFWQQQPGGEIASIIHQIVANPLLRDPQSSSTACRLTVSKAPRWYRAVTTVSTLLLSNGSCGKTLTRSLR